MAEIRVSYTGEGIDAEYLPFVFDRFSQADTSTKRRYGGLGIGLSIVKQIVELHGGSVKAESAGKGKGASFTVQIPLSTAADSTHKHDYPFSGMTKSDRLKGIKILAVDDEVDARDLLTVILGRFGAEVLAVDSAKAAIESLQHFTPHVLITDIGMPDEDGYDLLRKFRALEAKDGKTTPAMALTAFARDEDRLRALAEGFQFHLPKPVEPETLVEAVAHLAKM
jgi:CheY-like chemotaxis protein